MIERGERRSRSGHLRVSAEKDAPAAAEMSRASHGHRLLPPSRWQRKPASPDSVTRPGWPPCRMPAVAGIGSKRAHRGRYSGPGGRLGPAHGGALKDRSGGNGQHAVPWAAHHAAHNGLPADCVHIGRAAFPAHPQRGSGSTVRAHARQHPAPRLQGRYSAHSLRVGSAPSLIERGATLPKA